MSILYGNTCGFETGDSSEVSIGSPVVSATHARSGGYGAQTSSYFAILGIIGGTPTMCGFAIQFSGAQNWFWQADLDTSGPIQVKMKYNSDNTITLVNGFGSDIATTTNTFATGEWHYIEVEISNWGATNSYISVWINNNLEFDTLQSSTSGTPIGSPRYYFQGATNSIKVDDFYTARYDAPNTIDDIRLGNAGIWMHTCQKDSATPDGGGLIDTTGTDLDGGDSAPYYWSDTNTTPIQSTVYASYDTSSAAGGYDEVPLDSNIVLDPVWMKALIYCSRSGGGGTDQHVLMGNSVDGVIASGDLDIDTAPLLYQFRPLSSDAGYVPTLSQNVRIGFEKSSGGQDFDVYFVGVQILAPIPEPETVLDFDDSSATRGVMRGAWRGYS